MNTLIILDWDDTLFPTSWLAKNKIDLTKQVLIKKYEKYFEYLDKLVYSLLLKLQQYGKVVIITNAAMLWIEITANVMPNTVKILNNIDVISAKDKYKKFSNNIMDWKKISFLKYMIKYKESNFKNVISIGDAEYEYEALISLYKKFNNKNFKSIKFIKNPEFNILIEQLIGTYKSIKQISNINNNIDLKFNNRKIEN